MDQKDQKNMRNNNNDAKKDFNNRALAIFAVVFLLTGVLVYNLYVLQIRFVEKYSMLSDKNRIRLSPVIPKRGKFITADGKVIASSNRCYKLMVESCDEKTFLKNIDLISSCVHMSDNEKQRIISARKNTPRYTPIIIKDTLSWEEYSRLALIFFKFNFVSVDYAFTRSYDMPYEFSHVLGYTSRKSDGALRIIKGKTGAEFFFNNELTGKIGNTQMEINAAGKKMRLLESTDPTNGKDITITIDSRIQKFTYDLISKEKAGACVVLNVENGNVIAMVSVPGFDISAFSSRVTRKYWKEIVDDKLFPLMNRVISGTYPPGSLFKIVVAFAALSEGIVNPQDTVYCSGSTLMDNHLFHCVNRRGHGKVDLCDALKKSCDCYFFDVAKKLGIEKIAKYARQLGFGEKTGIEIPNENPGLVPDKTWKFMKHGQTWKPYETILVGIGQGAILSTLLQVAVMFGKIYSGNLDFAPTLIKKDSKDIINNPINCKNIDIIKKALYQVCNEVGGTAARSCRTQYGISGKTGSSQVRRIKDSEVGLVKQDTIPWKFRDHAFFVGCAPYDKPKYVVAVMVEHGGWGSRTAAPIARQIFDKLMELEKLEK